MDKIETRKSYATFGLARSYRQVIHGLKNRKVIERNTQLLYHWIKDQERLIVNVLGRPVENLRILEIGPGQGMQRARYFGLKNEVVGFDLDVIQRGFNLVDYFQMLKKNGAGRVLKTLGWQFITGRPTEKAWGKILGAKTLPYPPLIHGNICTDVPQENGFDLVLSWSVFEHLPDPEAALRNLIKSLRTGGILFISIHLYTSVNGHHDIRAFTGEQDTLPAWGHLREATRHLLLPSAYLNQWRLAQWRELFNQLTPGHQEILEAGDIPAKYGPQLQGELRSQLANFSEEELLNVNAVYVWKKP